MTACPAQSASRLRITRFRGRAIVRVSVYVDGRFVLARRGRSLRSVTVPGLPGRARHRVRLYEYTKRGFARVTTRHVYGWAHRG